MLSIPFSWLSSVSYIRKNEVREYKSWTIFSSVEWNFNEPKVCLIYESQTYPEFYWLNQLSIEGPENMFRKIITSPVSLNHYIDK